MHKHGVEKHLYPMPHAQKKFCGTFGTSSFPQNLKWQKGAYENFWGGLKLREGGPYSNRPPPSLAASRGCSRRQDEPWGRLKWAGAMGF